MRLAEYTDYSLRVLMYCAAHRGELVTIAELAERHAVSKNHLMKIVNDLGRRGYMITLRGRKGGIRLMRRPSEINIGRLVRETEDEFYVLGCLERAGYCRIERVCVLRGAVRDATSAFLAVLDGYTLADLIAPRKVLADLLLRQSLAPNE